MNAVNFPPPRRQGISIHSAFIAALLIIVGIATWLATREPVGPRFAFYIILAAAGFSLLPILGYRLWALMRANYQIDRENMTINWGLRSERIPISEIEWIRPASAIEGTLPLPPFHLPGSILGKRRSPEVGQVEFLASDTAGLLILATREHYIAISPADPQAFLINIQHTIELGSLSPSDPKSVYPRFIISEAWQNQTARYLFLAVLLLNIGLLVWVSLMIPSLGGISLGFLPSGASSPAVPAVGLILLPIISMFMSFLGWIIGLLFYRRTEQHPLAYVIWGSSLVASIFFLVGVFFIAITPA